MRRGSARPDLLDDAGSLVAEDARRVAGRIRARGGIEIGVADAARVEADERLALLRLGEVDVLDDERPSELLEDGRANLHGASLRNGGVVAPTRATG